MFFDAVIFPNPANDVLNIELVDELVTEQSRSIEATTIEITNTLGQLVYQKTENKTPTTKINIDHLQSGLYYISIKIKDKTVTQKIMIQK